MNVFFIPSWYPSTSDPLPGIFFREQALALARASEDIHVGISTWGQNDERLLLWAAEPIKNGLKLFFQQKPKSSTKQLMGTKAVEYFNPAYTWTSKLCKGNISSILKANSDNFHAFENHVGRVDIIHAHVGYPAGYIAGLISKEMRIPYIITEQMSPFPHKYFINKSGRLISELREAYQGADKIIAISSALASAMEHHNLKEITVIPNLVDEEFFKPVDHSIRNQEFTFFSLGRMVPQKGIDILLKAFASMHSKAQLRIGGDGPHLNEYRRLARDLKIDHKIIWLGQLDKNQALKEYQNCDAFVLPSRHESMGVVFAEAMACGKPSIATICGGPEEFIDDSVGYLASPEDVAGLQESMEKMLSNFSLFDPGLIRRKFEERFSSRVVTLKIREVYERVIKNYLTKK